MSAIADHLTGRGLRCAGFVQRDVPRPGRSRCDMVLADVATGATIAISQDRGLGARGCRLDEGELARAIMATMAALSGPVDLLLINKFGKAEAEGRGFIPLIGEAVALGVPLLIAVPWRNIECWRKFADGSAQEVEVGTLTGGGELLCAQLGLPYRSSATDVPVAGLLQHSRGVPGGDKV
jgi:nucleoside-triphosphatase THEP1